MDYSKLGRVITGIRQARKESGREMAKKLEIAHTHLHHIEHGRHGVSMDFLDRFKNVYGVDPYVLAFEPRLELCRTILDTWQNQQGHDRCWYYPEVFDSLCSILGVKNHRPLNLPPEIKFKRGCTRYRKEQYALPMAGESN